MDMIVIKNEITKVKVRSADFGVTNTEKYQIEVFDQTVIVTSHSTDEQYTFGRNDRGELTFYLWGTNFVTENKDDIEQYLQRALICMCTAIIFVFCLFGGLIYAGNHFGYF